MDYSKYKLTWRQWIESAGIFILMDIMIAWLFYDSLKIALLFMPLYILFVHFYKQWQIGRRKKQLKLQFREWMMLLYSLIAAGSSLENALKDSWKEMSGAENTDNYIFQELGVMIQKMAVNVNSLTCLEDFAVRSDDEDIYDFYEVIDIVKRQGGSMRQVIRSTVDRINEKIEMECEIETAMAGKKHEFMIMVCIPLGMIVYMRMGSPELMEVLYATAAGNTVMTLALIIYGAAVYWGLQITKIEL